MLHIRQVFVFIDNLPDMQDKLADKLTYLLRYYLQLNISSIDLQRTFADSR
jgi:hypothetical protein